MRHSKQFNIVMAVVSALIGAVVWLVCAAVYDALADATARPVLIGLLFGILALAVAGGVFATSMASGTFEKNVVTGGGTGSVIGILAIIVVGLMALGALFQWLYSLRSRAEAVEPTSYVFLIDGSGSMTDSDPRGLRYDAIDQVLADKASDFPYMVYGFADDVSLLRDMRPVSAGAADLIGMSSGGTSIRGVLERVISDRKSGLWDGGDAPKVVLLSDGLPTDFDRFSAISGILSEYARSGMSISTVGLDGADVSLMERIADRTGGVFVDIRDASMLAEAMTSAASRYAADDLVTTRYHSGRLGALWGVLRVVFLTVLGTLIGLAAAVAYGQMDSLSLIAASSAVKSLVGALLLELCTSLFDLPDRVFWLILWVLVAVTLCTRTAAAARRSPDRSRRQVRPSRSRGRSSRNVGTF